MPNAKKEKNKQKCVALVNVSAYEGQIKIKLNGGKREGGEKYNKIKCVYV